MVKGLEHAGIASPDPGKLAEWYVDRLGFTINYYSESSQTRFVRTPDGSMLEIILASGPLDPQQTLREAGIRHLALAVDDFEATYDRLKAQGVRFLTEPENSKGNKVVFFEDLDGNILHLIQREKPLP
jgi:glyoxylase I family protein